MKNLCIRVAEDTIRGKRSFEIFRADETDSNEIIIRVRVTYNALRDVRGKKEPSERT